MVPPISVITPVYNQEKLVQRCVDSILDQTLGNIEIIVINDGSTDGTQKILDQYGSKITVLKTRKGGPGGARNEGLKIAKGEYIFFLDSDDWLTDNTMLEKLYKHCESKDLDVIIYNFYHKTSESQYEVSRVNNVEYNKLFNGSELLELFLKGKISRYPWDKMMKRDLFQQSGFCFPEGLWFEDIFQIIYLMYAKRIQKVDLYPIYYWNDNMSITRSFTANIYDREKVAELTVAKINYLKLINPSKIEPAIEYFEIVNTILALYFDVIDKGNYTNLREVVSYVNNHPKCNKFKSISKNNTFLNSNESLYLFLIFNRMTVFLYLKKFFKWLK